jgi:hypothetical protein
LGDKEQERQGSEFKLLTAPVLLLTNAPCLICKGGSFYLFPGKSAARLNQLAETVPGSLTVA